MGQGGAGREAVQEVRQEEVVDVALVARQKDQRSCSTIPRQVHASTRGMERLAAQRRQRGAQMPCCAACCAAWELRVVRPAVLDCCDDCFALER